MYKRSTSGIGTENVTGLVDRLRKNLKGIVAPESKYNSQFSTLLNAKYFGDKDEAKTTTTYLNLKRTMREFLKSKPNEKEADAFFNRLIIEDFGVKGWFKKAGGGWGEGAFEQTFTDSDGREITQKFRFGDLRKVKAKDKVITEYYAGTDTDGRAVWIPTWTV